jgi:hypothetical protein
VSRGFWNDEKNGRLFLESIAKELKVRHPNEWMDISYTQLISMGAGSLLKRSGSLLALLEKYFPEKSWNKLLTGAKAVPSKSQTFLFKILQEIFPGTSISMDYTRYVQKVSNYSLRQAWDDLC